MGAQRMPPNMTQPASALTAEQLADEAPYFSPQDFAIPAGGMASSYAHAGTFAHPAVVPPSTATTAQSANSEGVHSCTLQALSPAARQAWKTKFDILANDHFTKNENPDVHSTTDMLDKQT